MSIQTRTPAPSRPRAKRLSSLHRLVGITVLLPVLVLVVTGVPLQFTEQLQLGQSDVHNSWLQASYGITAPETVLVSGEATQVGELVLIGEREVDVGEPPAGDLLGDFAHELATIVALQNAILLIPHDTSYQIEATSLPQPVTRFGTTASYDLIVATVRGGNLISYDLGASWEPTSITEVSWQAASRVEANHVIQARYRASQLSWERVLLDMHSGRIAGALGEWVMNFASFALVVLALSGFAMWLLPRPKLP